MAKKKSQALGDWLAQLSEDEVQNWAAEVMEELTDEHALALDVAGWKIVSTIDPTYRWPFNSKASGFECPDWCDDLWKPNEKPKPELMVIGKENGNE